MEPTLQHLPETQRAILLAVKGSGPLSTAELAGRLRVTYEAVRQHLSQLERAGWVAGETEREATPAPGRPRRRYRLTRAGDHLFPKHYDDLAVELVDALAAELGPAALKTVLAALADARVAAWQGRLSGLPLKERLEALRSVYLDQDPFTQVETTSDGSLRLVERNCPFLEVARRRPALCSITVSVLTRLLGCRVVREERFQEGDGRCAFRVLPSEPVDGETTPFDWEPAVRPV